MCTAGIRLWVAKKVAGEQPDIPQPFRSLVVNISKSPLLRKTAIMTSELTANTLEMASSEDGDLDIVMPGLFSAHLNLSHRQYFAEAKSQYLGLCTAHNDCD